tara:strand:+ start:303 stop:416 length:114 start_codon:yes stop_codon:yes gene_type:complete
MGIQYPDAVKEVNRYSVSGQNKYVLISIENKNTAMKE